MPRFPQLIDGVLRMVDSDPTIYDESDLIGVAGVATGTPFTLPAGGTYEGDELEVYLNGERIENVIDYNYVGVAPRTQVTFTFDLEERDRIRFRVDRNA